MLADITEALRRGDAAAALATAREAVAAEPENAHAHHLLGVCLQRSRDLAGARAALERALELAPDMAANHFSLATLKLAEGDVGGAIEGLKAALVLDPNQLGAYVLLAHLAVSRGDRAEAERNLRLAQRVAPEHPQVRVIEGYIAQANGDGERAIKCFTAAAEADPNLAAAQLALGQAYLSRRMWPFAEQALRNALRLDPSRAPSTLRALVEALRRQGKADETLSAVDELLRLVPADPVARVLRAELLVDQGRPEEAAADLGALLDAHPAHPPLLRQAVILLARLGRGEEALARAETALATQPDEDELWKTRLQLSGLLGEDAKDLLDRWQAARPASAACQEMLCGYFDARGNAAEAEAHADRALAIEPDLYAANLFKLRGELAVDPAAALARVERLLPQAGDAIAQRTLLGWRGLALDALGRHAEAAASWRDMVRRPATGQIPPPPPLPASEAPAGSIPGTLLYSPPGVRAEFVLRQAKSRLGQRLRLDRIGNHAAGDGFGGLRFVPGHPEAGSAERWQAALAPLGLDPAATIDWLPHVDGYTFAALGGAKVVALLTDPRDALLNWMLHGSLQNFSFFLEFGDAARWLSDVLATLADEAEASGRVVLVDLDGDAAVGAQALEQALGLDEPLPALSGRGQRLPAGHWRHYREAFAAEFAQLAQVAVRLGYPAD